MKKLILVLAVSFFAGSAFAGGSCGAAACDLGGGCDTLSVTSSGNGGVKTN